MKMAICSTGESVTSAVEMRFGRAPFFVLVDMESGSAEGVKNPGALAPGGAGPKTAQFLCDKGVDVVLAGKLGPKALQAIKGAGIEVYCLDEGRVDEAILKFKENQLAPYPMS